MDRRVYTTIRALLERGCLDLLMSLSNRELEKMVAVLEVHRNEIEEICDLKHEQRPGGAFRVAVKVQRE